MIGMTRCTKQVLSNWWMTCQSTLPCFARRRGMSYNRGCINTYLRNQVCSIHSLACKTSSHQVAWWDIGKLIFGAHTLNANVPFLLIISYEMMADINMLCSCMLNQIVGELDSTLIITQQWHLFELDSKIIQGGLHPKNLCTTTTGGYVFGFGGW